MLTSVMLLVDVAPMLCVVSVCVCVSVRMNDIMLLCLSANLLNK